jgi:DNA polymerase-3 subunit delta
MIIFLYGQDSYRLKQNLEKIVDEYRRKYSGLNFDFLDLHEAGHFSKLEGAIKTNSFFNEKRLIVAKNAFAVSEEVAALIKTWNLVDDKDRILLFYENTDKPELTKKGKKLFALLTDKLNVVKIFQPLEGKYLENWLAKEIKQSGAEIDPPALKKLVAYAGKDSWRLGQEVNKLANYKYVAELKRISVEDVKLLVQPDEDLGIFEVIDAIASKNKAKASAMLHSYLGLDYDPHYVLSMIIFQFRNLLRVKSLVKNAIPYSDMLQKTSFKPFVLNKTYEQCRRFDLDELKQLFAYLARLDLESKSGQINLTDGLYQFVFSLQN